MKLAFETPSGDKTKSANGVFFDKLICLKTKSPYCHCELVFNSPQTPLSNSYCFSSSPADGGVRFKNIDLTTPDWKLIEIGDYNIPGLNIALKYIGQKYDWMGIFGFVLPFGQHDGDDKFCSEVCALVLKKLELLPSDLKTWEVSPGKLFDLVTNK